MAIRPLQQWQRQGLNRATTAGNQGQYLQNHPGVAQHQQKVAQRQAGQQPAAQQGNAAMQAGGGLMGGAPQGSGNTGAPKAGGQGGGAQGQAPGQPPQQIPRQPMGGGWGGALGGMAGAQGPLGQPGAGGAGQPMWRVPGYVNMGDATAGGGYNWGRGGGGPQGGFQQTPQQGGLANLQGQPSGGTSMYNAPPPPSMQTTGVYKSPEQAAQEGQANLQKMWGGQPPPTSWQEAYARGYPQPGGGQGGLAGAQMGALSNQLSQMGAGGNMTPQNMQALLQALNSVRGAY